MIYLSKNVLEKLSSAKLLIMFNELSQEEDKRRAYRREIFDIYAKKADLANTKV